VKGSRGKSVIGYVRVSRKNGREGETYIAPKLQREDIERFVQAQGHELISVVVDEDQSGGKLDRPGLNRVMAALEAGEADAIAVAYLSRLSRKTVDGLQLVQRLNDLGRHVLIADQDMDTTTTNGKMMLTILLAVAEWELGQRRAHFVSAQRNAMIDKKVWAGSTPIGYVRTGRTKDGKPCGPMIPNPKTAPVIKALYRRRAKGQSWSSLARWLDGELPREDGTTWLPSTVKELLRTPLNMGRLERTIGGEKIVVDNAHEALVSRGEWEAVNASQGNGPTHRSEAAMLAGIGRCATCGGPMTRSSEPSRDRTRRYDSYKCSRSTSCDKPARISATRLNSHVLGIVLHRLAASAAIEGRRPSSDGGERTNAERELENAEHELRVYATAVSAADLGEAAFAEGARLRREAMEDARDRLAQIAAREGAGGPSYRDLLDRLPSMGDGERNAALRTILDHVVVTPAGAPGVRGNLDERVRVIFRGDDRLEDAARLGDHVGPERDSVAA
jgi:DNA invertase Pin-like site-specific DNA recombinase